MLNNIKAIINRTLSKRGFVIKKQYNNFSLNNELQWLQEKNFTTIIDIGANTGQFACFARKLFPSARILSFEPIENCFLQLKQNCSDFQNFEAYNFGLGDENVMSDFYLNDFTPSSSLLKISDISLTNFPYTKSQKVTKVQVKRLDDITEQLKINKEGLIKIDVQGFEKKVIEGGINFLNNFRGLLIIETSIKPMYISEPSFNEIYKVVTDLGFSYKGNLDQLYSPQTGEILQVDAIFSK